MELQPYFFSRIRAKAFLVVLLSVLTFAVFFVPQVRADPIIAQYPFSAVNSTQADTPQCGGNTQPLGPNCPSVSAGTIGMCFQPTLTGTLGSASLMLELGQVPNGVLQGGRRGQPSIQSRIYILQNDPSTTYGTTCRAVNPFSTAAIVVAISDPNTLCFSGSGCFCSGCVGLNVNFQVVTWAFSGSSQPLIAAGATYVIVLYLECTNPLGCVYDDNNSVAQGVDGNAGYAGAGVSCTACMVADPISGPSSGAFGRSTYDRTTSLGRQISLPFAVFSTSGGTTTPPSSCNGGNCGAVLSTSSTTGLNFNGTLTLFYIASAPFNGFIVNVTSYVGKPYIGTVYLGVYIVNQGCTTAAGPFSVQCPGILAASTTFQNPQGPVKLVFVTQVQINAGQVFAAALSATVNGLWVNDTNTPAVLDQTGGTLPTIINQFSVQSSTSKVALFAGLFQGTSPPNVTQNGNTTVGDMLIGLVDFFGMGRLAGGLAVLLIFFLTIVIGIGLTTFHLGRRPGGSPRPGFPPVGFLMIFLFLVFIFSAPIGTGGISVLPPWVTIFTMMVFAWMFTEGILRRGGRF